MGVNDETMALGIFNPSRKFRSDRLCHPGEDFSSDLSWIKPNVTNQKDIQALLGTPYKVGSASGTPTWTYGFYRFSLVGESHTKELKFYWTPEKKVADYSFSSSFPADRNKELMSRPGFAFGKLNSRRRVSIKARKGPACIAGFFIAWRNGSATENHPGLTEILVACPPCVADYAKC